MGLLTELDAVNAMLDLVGELPVNTLETSGVSVASSARACLNRVSREIQKRGLHGNFEKNFVLPIAEDGCIYLPPNTLKVDNSRGYSDVVQRGSRLYDKVEHTYKFKAPIQVDIVFFLPFEELEQHVRDYVAIRAGRQFEARTLGSGDIQAATEKDELEALTEFRRGENRAMDANFLSHPSHRNIFRYRRMM